MKPEIKKNIVTAIQAPTQNDLEQGDSAIKKIIDIKLQDLYDKARQKIEAESK